MQTQTSFPKNPSEKLIPEDVVPYWLVLLLGIFTLLFGILVLVTPAGFPTVLTHLLGLYWLLTGILLLVSVFLEPTLRVWKVAGGIMGGLAGLFILQHPAWTPVLGTEMQLVILTAAGIALGVSCLMLGLRRPNWGLGAAGILNIVLGAMLLLAPVLTVLSSPILLGAIIIGVAFVIIIRSFI